MPLPQIRTDLPSIIGDALRDRFYKQQLDMFMQNEYAEYQSELNNLTAALGDPSDPDMASKILQSYKASTNKMLVNATRYAKNPYIAQLSQAHFQHDMKQFDNIVQLAGASMEAETERELAPKKRELLEQKIQTQKSLGEKYKAEAAKAEAVAPVTGFFDRWDLSSPGRALGALRRTDDKGLNQRRIQEMGEIQQSLAAKIIEERRQAKAHNPATSMPWGQGGKGEIDQVRSEIPLERVRELWEMRTLKNDLGQVTGMGEDQIELMFPQYDWPSKAPTTVIQRGLLAPEEVGALILGDGYQAIMGEQALVKGIKEIADKLPNDINVLGKGNVVTQMFNALLQNGGNNPTTQEPFKDYKSYKAWIDRTSREWVNEKIGGAGIADAELDKETLASRQKARAFMNMAMEKYAAHIAREIGGIPGTPATPEGYFSKLIPAGIKSAIEGFFGEETVVPPPSPISETKPGVKGPALKEPAKAPAAPALLDFNKVQLQSLDTPKRNKYYQAISAFDASIEMAEWDPIGPNKDGDLIIKNSKTGKLTLATWDGSTKTTGLKPKGKKK